MNTKKKAFWAVGILTFLVFVFPGTSSRSWSYECRLCEASKNKRITSFLGIPVWISRSGPEETRRTKIYVQKISFTHEHEWMGGGYSTSTDGLLVPRMIGCGSHRYGSFPPFQNYLTSMALDIIDVLPATDGNTRRQFFTRMVNTTNWEEYMLLDKAYSDAKPSDIYVRGVHSNIVIPDWVRTIQPSTNAP